jgi:hypothetical protein
MSANIQKSLEKTAQDLFPLGDSNNADAGSVFQLSITNVIFFALASSRAYSLV